jgi:ligand-binding SRPBCC domain-containing protein
MTSAMRPVEQTSVVALPAHEMWKRATTPEGINDELAPLLRMTIPRSLRGKTIDDVEVGIPLGRSWLLLGGLVPIDYDDLCLAELDRGRRFRERSKTLSFAVWQHERTVEPAGETSCRVTDRLGFELKRSVAWIPGAESLAASIVAFLFRHRHRRLGRLKPELRAPAPGSRA